jgi:hypothetical protein
MKQGWTRRSIFLVIFVFLARATEAFGTAPSGTVPFIFDDNRIFAELEFARPDGTLRKAIAFVDIGTPQLVIEESLGKELTSRRGDLARQRFRNRRAGISVQTDTGLGMTGPDGKRTLKVEAVLPGSVMKNYQVVLDYAKRRLTIAKADAIKPASDGVPCRMNAKTGLVSVTATIDGHDHAMAICGSAACRSDIAARWIANIPIGNGEAQSGSNMRSTRWRRSARRHHASTGSPTWTIVD